MKSGQYLRDGLLDTVVRFIDRKHFRAQMVWCVCCLCRNRKKLKFFVPVL